MSKLGLITKTSPGFVGGKVEKVQFYVTWIVIVYRIEQFRQPTSLHKWQNIIFVSWSWEKTMTIDTIQLEDRTIMPCQFESDFASDFPYGHDY
jgi:hypothetical protein